MLDLFANTYKGKKVVVTGDTGFKGSWLCIWLKELGADVYGYALPPLTEKDNYVTVVLDTNLTPELIEEGFVREIVSKIQTMRKDAGFEVMDKIHVTVSGNDKISALIDKNAAQITKIVLAEDITEGEAKGFTKEWNINGEQVTLGVERI